MTILPKIASQNSFKLRPNANKASPPTIVNVKIIIDNLFIMNFAQKYDLCLSNNKPPNKGNIIFGAL